MMLPTEQVGSIPRPAALIEGIQDFEAGRISQPELNALYHSAVQDTIQRLEATGSPVITDGEQAKHSFATYSIYGLENLAPDGMPISFAEGEIRRCLRKGAHVVQMDFTEGRLSLKLDPTRRLLHSFIDLNNLVLERFSAEERKRLGVHTCPGADRHSSHSAEVDYAELLPRLFELQATNF